MTLFASRTEKFSREDGNFTGKNVVAQQDYDAAVCDGFYFFETFLLGTYT
jgi:hypothetical protein